MFYDAIIVLGMHMPDGQAPEELVRRVDKAADCWIEGRAPIVIPCGGQRSDEPFAEAEWMAQQLMTKGLPEFVLRPEIESRNTEQNLANAFDMIHAWGGKAALVVTSDTHLPRAMAICRDLGLLAKGVPVKTPGGPGRVVAWLRECLGFVEYKLGLQKRDGMGPFQRFVRKVTRS